MISNKYKTIFVHNPKCAGTSIKTALQQNTDADWRYNDWHYSYHQLGKKSVYEIDEYYTFAFVRNPYDRFVSAFCYNVEKIMDPTDYHWESYPLAYRVIKKYVDMGFQSDDVWGGADLINAFKLFVKSNDFPRIYEFGWPVHFRPQSYFFHTEDLSILGRYEDLMSEDCIIPAVEKATGLELKVPYTNMGVHPDYREFYDAKTMDLVKIVYMKDFLEFGYNMGMLGDL